MDFAYVSSGGPWDAALLGVVAGLAVALPLGAIGLLLVREGLAHGFRTGAAAALAVGTVDLVYATVAVFAGSWVSSLLTGREQPVRLVGAAVLVAVAVVGLVRAVRAGRQEDPVPPTTTAPRAFARFLGLTAVNPLTALTFVAVAVALGPRLATTGDRAAFVGGAFLASLSWQLVLVGLGAFLGARVSPRVQTVLQVLGFAVVLVLAVVLALG